MPEGISCGSSVAGMTIPETENFTGVAPVPRAVPVPRFAMDQMHQLGRCTPCRFFAFKDDGCHKGDSCTSVCLSQKKERKVNKLKTKCKKLGDIMLEHFEKKRMVFFRS